MTGEHRRDDLPKRAHLEPGPSQTIGEPPLVRATHAEIREGAHDTAMRVADDHGDVAFGVASVADRLGVDERCG